MRTMNRLCALVGGIGPLLCFGSALAQVVPAPGKDFFRGRRLAVMAELKRSAKQESKSGRRVRPVVLVRGATTAAAMDKFYQDHGAYYLSGVVEPDIAIVLDPMSGKDTLLVPPFSRFTATWEGRRLAPGEAAAERTGFAEVGNVRGLAKQLDTLLARKNRAKTVVWTFKQPQPNLTSTPSAASRAARATQRDPFDGRVSREQRLVDYLEREHKVEVRDLGEIVGKLRAVKQPAEIAAVRAASEAAAAGIAAAMRVCAPGKFEYELAAAARYEFSKRGAGPDAYAAIVGAGKNGCVLHYSAIDQRMEAGQLVVMDYAPTVHGYASDVTRTFPVDGKFTPEQRKLVLDVLSVQQALIADVRPGARLSQLSRKCSKLLRKLGYRVDHGPCHHVGLAVHDKQGDVLEPGMVFTVEPGAYLRKEGMGCRIEDVVLVTEDGHEVLSAGVPAHPDAIERWMAEARAQGRAGGGIGR